jgi:hypothetical protein
MGLLLQVVPQEAPAPPVAKCLPILPCYLKTVCQKETVNMYKQFDVIFSD